MPKHKNNIEVLPGGLFTGEVLKLPGNKAMHLKSSKTPAFTVPEAFLFRNKNQIISLSSQELVPAVNSLEEVFL